MYQEMKQKRINKWNLEKMRGYDGLKAEESGINAQNFRLPALDIYVAFPQATPPSLFPPSVSDYYQFPALDISV